MRGIRFSLTAKLCLPLTMASLCTIAIAQGIPDANVNVIGINPPAALGEPVFAIPDIGLKQQNEPACAIKPTNPLHLICAFNDYRGVDDPTIGDAWEGYAYSINGGQTWYSDLLPGHQGDSPSLGFEFAADPQVVTAPGISLISYLAANRGEGAAGGLFLHRLFEVNREAGSPWEPEILPVTVALGRRSKFIDKPVMMLQLDESASTVMVSSTLRDGSTVSRQVPAGRLFLAYTTFEDDTSTIYVAYSDNYGESWTTKQISRTESLNQSASLAVMGDKVCAVWRRFEPVAQKTQPLRISNSDGNAIRVACSKFRGEKWFKPNTLAAAPGFFPFDQGTTAETFRVNSYPTITSDGTRFYALWSSRDASASPFFARVVYSSSIDGVNWTVPKVLDDVPLGHQVMPVATAARGVVQIAWYDTRNSPFQSNFIQDILDTSTNPPTKVLRNPGDVRTAQIVNGIATPSVQVSRYIEGIREGDVGPARQLQFNFLNDRLFQQGLVPFNGDYPHITAPAFRLEDGIWVSNASAGADDEPVDFFVSFTDNRDVRGNVWEDLTNPTVYTPADAGLGATGDADSEADDDDAQRPAATQIAGAQPQSVDTGDAATNAESKLAVSVEGDARADAEPDPTDFYPTCVPDGRQRDRTRDQNIYSSVVRPGVSIASPSASKPTGSVQRAHVVWISNNTSAPVTYTATIDNQPPDAPIDGRASFLQVPVAPFATDDGGLLESLDVDIDPNSTVARTVFVTSALPEQPVHVSVRDATGEALGRLTLNPDDLTPLIQDPDVPNPDVQNPDIQNAEVHNPDVQNAVVIRVQNPDVQNPDVQNPDVQNPDVQNPDVQNPDIQNPDIQNPDVQNSTLDSSSTENPDLGNDSVTQDERDAGYTDFNWETTNSGNTTTAFNLDAFVSGDNTGLSTQLIGMRTHKTPTSRDCVPGTQVTNQVIFNLVNPDLDLFEQNTNAGEFADGSAYIAPGETIVVTLRVWGDPDFPEERAGIRVEAQSCNSEDKDLGTMACDPPVMQVGSFDEGPVITGPPSPIFLEAFADKVGTGAYTDFYVVVTDDIDEIVELTCIIFDGKYPTEFTDTDEVYIDYFVELDQTIDIECTATDSSENTSQEVFTVTAEDTTPPEINIGFGGQTDYEFFTCNSEYQVYYQDDAPPARGGSAPHVSAFDAVDFDDVSLDCIPPSGSDETVFPLNQSTLVTCTAEDSRGNSAQDSFDLIVIQDKCRLDGR